MKNTRFQLKRLAAYAPLIDGSAVFLLACVLVGPLFFLEYLNNWASIEGTFITNARVIREHLPHPAWMPLWYCGTRFDYIYPPALQYGTALLSLLLRISTVHAYHLYIALFYALGMAGVYSLVYVGTRSRRQAWFAAACTALLSPSFTLMRDLRIDSPFRVPQRLHVLISYGEGPHISSLAILGFALAASYVALRRWNPLAFVASSVLSAALVATNFYGATALAIFFPILAWAVFLNVKQAAVWGRAAAIAAAAYGLCAFWLTPSYIRITQQNMRWVAQPGKPLHILATICFAAIFCLVTHYAGKRWKMDAWLVFLWGSAIFVSIYVLGFYYFGFSVTGNSLRLAPEFDLALILLATYYLAIIWRHPTLRSGLVVLLFFTLWSPASRYLHHAWTIFPPAANVQNRPEFQTTKWLSQHLPDARVFSDGSIRLWYDTWYNNSEVYGGSDQGLLNQIIPLAAWEISQGDKAELTIAWLQALGADAVIVSDKTSAEVYHDYAHLEKFSSAFQAIYDDHQGNVIYRVPRRYPERARVVERSGLVGIPTPRNIDDLETLTRYLAAVEHGPDSPVTFRRANFETVDLAASTTSSQAVLLQETFDSAWHAYSDGRPLRIERDPMGFMLIHSLPGQHPIHVAFELPWENRIGWGLTLLTCAFLAVLLCAAPQRRVR